MLVYRKREAERTFFERPEGMPRLLHALLIQRGIASAAEAEAFLSPDISLLRDPMLLSDMDKAVSHLRAALEAGRRICVYGDYDVDGVTASAILCLHLKSLGADVRAYIPDRHREGYGLNEQAVRALAADTDLLVTVDCGVNAVDMADLALSLGMDIVITDHHRPGEALPACPLVNPLLNGYPCPHLSGAGVAFKLVEALSGRAAAMEYIDLAALSTVADVVPLLDENRFIVRAGLERMNKQPRVGIAALKRAAALEGRALTAGHLGFQIGPRLNAGGRLGSARRGLELLTTDDEARAETLAAALEAENSERRSVEGEILKQAEAMLAGFDFPARRAIVLARAGWNTGVLGLAAARLVEKYHYPTILLSDEDGVLKGSCRSIPGVDIFAALTAAGEWLTRFGGHKQAAGLTLSRENLEPFCQALEKHLWETVPAETYVPSLEYDLSVSLGELDAYAVAALEKMQPTGMGNPAPVLRAKATLENARRVGRDGAHLRLTARDGGGRLTGVMFSAGERAGGLQGEHDLLFSPKINTWQGRTSVEIELRAMEPLDARARISANHARRDALVVRFLTELFYNKEIDLSGGTRLDAAAVRAHFDEAPQGTLLAAADFDEAAFLLDILEKEPPARFDLAVGAYPTDARAFNAVCLLPVGAVSRCYRRVIWAGQIEGAPVCAWRAELPDVDGMRGAYRALRDILRRPARYEGLDGLWRLVGAECGLSAVGAGAAFLALADMRLIETDETGARLLPMEKRDPMQSGVVKQILRLRA